MGTKSIARLNSHNNLVMFNCNFSRDERRNRFIQVNDPRCFKSVNPNFCAPVTNGKFNPINFNEQVSYTHAEASCEQMLNRLNRNSVFLKHDTALCLRYKRHQSGDCRTPLSVADAKQNSRPSIGWAKPHYRFFPGVQTYAINLRAFLQGSAGHFPSPSDRRASCL